MIRHSLFVIATVATLAAIQSTASADDDRTSKPNVKHLIDTHIHIYDTDRAVYAPNHPDAVPWPPADDTVLHKPHLPAEYKSVSQPAGVTGVIVVEASPRLDDNRWVLDLVENDRYFVGLVGNIDPFAKPFGKALNRLRSDPRFVGIRVHLMEKSKGFSDDPTLLENLRLLASADLALDVLMNGEGPETIEEVARIARHVPSLRIVVNHVLGYDIDGKIPGQAWIDAVKELANNGNVSVKISGLYQRCEMQPAPHDIRHYDVLLDVLWSAFGSERLIYGSNWPCTKKSGDYASFVRLVNTYFAGKGQVASERFFWQNASKAYKLNLQ